MEEAIRFPHIVDQFYRLDANKNVIVVTIERTGIMFEMMKFESSTWGTNSWGPKLLGRAFIRR